MLSVEMNLYCLSWIWRMPSTLSLLIILQAIDPKNTTSSRDLLLLGADIKETVSHVHKVTILITVLLTYNRCH